MLEDQRDLLRLQPFCPDLRVLLDGDRLIEKCSKLLDDCRQSVKDEEKRVEGLFAKARKAGLDMDELAASLAAEKKDLMAKYKAKGTPKPDAPALPNTTLA